MKSMLRTLTPLVIGLALLSVGSPAAAMLINFDAPADGTVIDNYYFLPLSTSVTFSNPPPLNASIYARSSLATTSPGNVVSVLQTGGPQFNAYYGAVDATINTVLLDTVTIVSIRVAAVASGEPLGIPKNKPFMQVWDLGNVYLGQVNFAGALPTSPWQVTPFERLSFKLPPCVGGPIACADYGIGRVRLSSQQTQGGPPVYALFDDLELNPVTCSNLTVVNGDGSSCNRTLYGDACSSWTCTAGYSRTGSDPVCVNGAWSGPAICAAPTAVPLLPGFGQWLLVAALLSVPAVFGLSREVRRRAS
jgi:hypothetical protein